MDPRICKGCGKSFVPQHAGHTVCNNICWGGLVRRLFPTRVPTKAELAALMTPHAPEAPAGEGP